MKNWKINLTISKIQTLLIICISVFQSIQWCSYCEWKQENQDRFIVNFTIVYSKQWILPAVNFTILSQATKSNTEYILFFLNNVKKS